MTVDRALLWPFLPDYVEQVVVNTDLSVSHKMKFAPNRLLPIDHANESRLHEGKSFLSQIELPEAAAARAFVTRRQDHVLTHNWLEAEPIRALVINEQMTDVEQRFEG
jgi:hypothetical protein